MIGIRKRFYEKWNCSPSEQMLPIIDRDCPEINFIEFCVRFTMSFVFEIPGLNFFSKTTHLVTSQ